MGLGGYLASRSDAEHYDGERRREQRKSGTSRLRSPMCSRRTGVSAEGEALVVRALKARPRRVSTRVSGGLGPRVA
jgi:hypothetical protein